MTKYYHCALVKHENNDKPYLFCVGRDAMIKNGAKVACDTRIGITRGTVVGDSFMVSKDTLESICVAVGATLPLRKIIGIEKKVKVEQITYFDGYNLAITEMPF